MSIGEGEVLPATGDSSSLSGTASVASCEEPPAGVDAEPWLRNSFNSFFAEPLSMAKNARALQCWSPYLDMRSRVLIVSEEGESYTTLARLLELDYHYKLLEAERKAHAEESESRLFVFFFRLEVISIEDREQKGKETYMSTVESMAASTNAKAKQEVDSRIHERNCPRVFQGRLEGSLRRIRWTDLELRGSIIEFEYSVSASSTEQGKRGSLDLEDFSLRLETLGRGQLERNAEGKWQINLDTGIFIAI